MVAVRIRDAPDWEELMAPRAASTPWPIIRTHTGSIGAALVACVMVLLTIELAIFRSGFFMEHFSVATPDFPAAKIALAARHSDARVIYVGDSTVMTGIEPAVVSDVCRCGPGFNAGFAASDPWLTAAMTRRLLRVQHPSVVVIGVSPWTVDGQARFVDSFMAHELLTPGDYAALGKPLDVFGAADAAVAGVWSAYGQRALLKEWVSSMIPGQQYDEANLGYYAPGGSLTGAAQLVAAASQINPDPADLPTLTGQWATVTSSLIESLRARGIAVVLLLPPLHPVAYDQAGEYLRLADSTIREFAAARQLQLIDCRSSVSPSDFRDLIHLRDSGAVKQSACVGEHLRRLLAG
jgi:hypothetical protein